MGNWPRDVRRARGLAAAVRTAVVCATVMAALSGKPAAAAQPFDAWLADLRKEAESKGISSGILDQALTGIAPIPRVIELDRNQPEFTWTFQQYIDRVVPQSRIETGRRKLAENLPLLRAVAEKYGVQPRFIVALWGIETGFGRTLGGFPVIDSLATLAHDGRRSAYFREELLNALAILEQGHIAPADMIGSWAGAMGQSQFMPSSFLNFAEDFDGDGRKDIWHTRADVFGSAANYLARSGWNDDRTWGRRVSLPPDLDPAIIADDETRRPLSEWQALGVRRADGTDLPGVAIDARLITPADGPEPAFLAYPNYDVILTWNRSHYFALAVGLLSDAIGRRGG